MKKNILASICLTAFFAVGIISLNIVSDSGVTSVYANSSGAPSGGNTGSPMDMNTCNTSGCHTGSVVNSGTGMSMMSATILASGYVPGQTYTITGSITETGISKFGFEITAERDADNSKVGTYSLSNAAETQVLGGASVTHRAAGTTGTGNKSWSFDWVAPAAGTGDVTFYGAFNATNSNSSTSGDNIYTAASLSFSEDLSVGLIESSNDIAITLFPNPVKNSFEISTTETIDNVLVYNLIGKEMVDVNKTANKFDISSLSAGIYFVQIESEGNVVIKKIIKE